MHSWYHQIDVPLLNQEQRRSGGVRKIPAASLTSVSPCCPGIRGPIPGMELNEWSHAIIGAAIEVHRTLGPGYLESVYEEALAVELKLRQIPFSRQHSVALTYKGHSVGDGRLDFLVARTVVVELKAVDTLQPIHQAQVMSYLKATGCGLGLLINFKVPVLASGIKRIML
jgi:GxxExxY protein